MSSQATSTALQTQGRVIWALALREIKTLFGNFRLGYLWQIIQTAFFVAVFWALRTAFGFTPPHGMSVPVFLIVGFTVWNIFKDSISRNLGAVGANRALLTYPQVFPLDIIVARLILLMVTHLIVMLILLSVASYMGYAIEIVDWGKFVLSLFLVLLTGLGLGSFFSSLNLFWPTTSRLTPMALRIMFFLSGVFWEPVRFQKYVGDIFLYNPALLLIELFRESFSTLYVSAYISMNYLLGLIVTSLFFGLLFERFSRRWIE